MSKHKKYTRGPKRSKNGSGQLKSKIIKTFLKANNKLLNYKQIAASLKLTASKDRQDIIRTLAGLAAENKIEEVNPGKYKFIAQDSFLEGKVDMTAKGSAYILVPELDSDIFISQNNTLNAFDGDTVKIYAHPKKKNSSRQEGEIIEVIERAKTRFVGSLEVSEKFAFVIADNKKIHVDFYVALEHLKGAEDGDKVVVELMRWPSKMRRPFGKIAKVLGKPGEHNVEIHSILEEYGLPYEFPAEIEQAAEDISFDIPKEEIQKRRDMRHITTFTIDPKDAKDFDDALSFERLENGNIEVGVHIADVSHYVQEGSILDQEAYKRATSVYLVDRVVPMLPEKLSNGVCSLRPEEEKLTFSAVFELNDKAEIQNQWFGRTVTYSDKRFAYEDAQEIIEGADGPYKEEILKLHDLASQMRSARLNGGAISFDRVEVRFNLDENKEPLGVYFKQSKEANHLIEEFMLLANKKVSEFVSLNQQKEANGKTFIYRIHDEPDPLKLQSLKTFIKQFGYSIDLQSRKSTSNSMNQLLKNVKGKGEGNMIENLTLRSMSKAVYSTENIGHYGLNFDYYSHFTSPIRRYPDVIAHRLLQHYLDKKSSPDSESFEVDSQHCSGRERLAAEAERQSTKYMQVKFMQRYVGQEFEGIISGITEWGIYVEIPENKCEGMIKLSEIREDHFVYDEKNYCIKGLNSRKKYQLGDAVTILVANADLKKKQLDFDWVTKQKQFDIAK